MTRWPRTSPPYPGLQSNGPAVPARRRYGRYLAADRSLAATEGCKHTKPGYATSQGRGKDRYGKGLRAPLL